MEIKNRNFIMKEKFRLISVTILFIILVLVGASLIGDFLTFILGNKLNRTWFFIIHLILIFILIEILFKTNFGRYIESKLFKKRKDKKWN
ncbi:hypothetical protein HYT25_02350 [Candidatus Pacearchaeota archaeon]|nr:hypothetical protein [Candidatus Pacearchaeota archaeon]